MGFFTPENGKVELFHPTLITGRGAHLVIKIVLSGTKTLVGMVGPLWIPIAHRFRIHAAIRFRHAVRKGRGLVIYERGENGENGENLQVFFLFVESNNWENLRIFLWGAETFFIFL